VSSSDKQVTVTVHGKPWAGWPGGEPQSVRDAYDELLAGNCELWTGDGGQP
jgi:hypothetical protein